MRPGFSVVLAQAKRKVTPAPNRKPAGPVKRGVQEQDLLIVQVDDAGVAARLGQGLVEHGFGPRRAAVGAGRDHPAVRPDGSGSEHVYKNTCVLPCALIDARSIPGSQRLITVGAGHHGGLDGPVILVDNRLNRRDPLGMTNLTPEISYPGMFPLPGKGGCGKFRQPYPFSEKFFLISHSAPPFGEHKRFSLHVFDAWGNRAELYKDPDISCFLPVPLRPRRVPTRITSVARREKDNAQREQYEVENTATDVP